MQNLSSLNVSFVPHSFDFESFGNALHIEAEQEFLLGPSSIEGLTPDLVQKTKVLAPYLQEIHLKNRSVLDLGANAAFFSILSLYRGASKATALDTNDDAISSAISAKKQFNLINLEIAKGSIQDWDKVKDVVLALGILPCLYSCDSQMTSLSAVVAKLASLARHICIIEWFAAEDPVVQQCLSHSWKPEFQSESYTSAHFENALDQHFSRWEIIGKTSESRTIYVAFVERNKIELNIRLPELFDDNQIISSSRLCSINNLEIWCRVYDHGRGETIKQASFDLASREARFLKQMPPEFVPKVIASEENIGWSVLRTEKVDGVPLQLALPAIDTAQKFYEFSDRMLEILQLMQERSISHNDINIENVFVKNGKPILTGFTWASQEQDRTLLPAEILKRAPYGNLPSDVHSIGVLLKEVNSHRFPTFFPLQELMLESDPQLRVENPLILRMICKQCLVWSEERAISRLPKQDQFAAPVNEEQEIREFLINLLGLYSQRMASLKQRYDAVAQDRDQERLLVQALQASPAGQIVKSAAQRNSELSKQLEAIHASAAYKLSCHISKVRQLVAPDSSLMHKAVIAVLRKLRLKR